MSRPSRPASHPASHIDIETLSTEPQFREAVALQKTIWGYDDIDMLPLRFFVVAKRVGGQVYGAYADGRMIAFCLAIPGLRGREVYLHSHMLGVVAEYRDQGIGRRIKLHQRNDALRRRIDLIEWTFDPLEFRNAYFNIERLGVTVSRYVRNQYGSISSSAGVGLPTDRCIADWRISSDRVNAAVAGEPRPATPVAARVEVPGTISELRRTDPARALEIQARIADEFEQCFARSLIVIGVERSGSGGTYLFGEPV